MAEHQSINEEVENINNALTGTTFLDYYVLSFNYHITE